MPRSFLVALALVGATACVHTPPAPAPERSATPVAADFDATWEAVIDHFAEHNVPISTIDRSSGLIATERLRVSPSDAREFSDCGKDEMAVQLYATTVVYNVLVRPADQGATLRVTASWDAPAIRFGCTTKGVWEAATEEAIKARAEGKMGR